MASSFDRRPVGRRRRVTTADGVALEVREWGDPQGPELLLVTGVAQSYLSFVKQYAALGSAGPAHRLLRPRGHGLSDKPLGDRWYQEGRRWSDEVASVIEAAGLKRPVLAGWSLGGRIVRQYLVDHGDDGFAGVAFISARPVEVPEVLGGGNGVMARSTWTMSAAVSMSRRPFCAIASASSRPPKNSPSRSPSTCCVRSRSGCRSANGGPRRKSPKPPSGASRCRPSLLTAPTTCLSCPAAGEMTARLVPHARLSLYQGCGHSVFFEQPARFNAELLAFVREATAAPSAHAGPLAGGAGRSGA